MSNTELIPLVKRCAENDRKAQYDLYTRLAPKMLGVCMRYAADRSEAEDFLQESFIRMFSKLHQYKFEGSFEGWVRRIMVNTSLELLRRSAKSRNHTNIDDVDYQMGEDESIIAGISSQELLVLVQELPPMYRAVFNLYILEGFKHREIAEKLNISEGTSKSNLSDARGILKKKITKLYGER